MVLNETTRVLNMTKQLRLIMRKQHNTMIKQKKIKGRRLINIVAFAIVMDTHSQNVLRRWKPQKQQ